MKQSLSLDQIESFLENRLCPYMSSTDATILILLKNVNAYIRLLVEEAIL